MPTLGFHVPDDSPLVKKVQERANTDHDGKVSAYVRKLVERDIEGPRGFSALQIDRWMGDEAALLRAGRYALTILHNPDAVAREKAAKEMAQIISDAIIRKPTIIPDTEELALKVAEEQARYGARSIKPKTEIRSPRNKKAGEKSA
jgi:hypothetical protein